MMKISFREKVGYGLGDAASSMFWKLFSMYLLFFYTDVFGINAAAVGTMFLITRIWDTINDPIVGVIADRSHSRWGKFRPYILWTAIPFGLFGVLTFSSPDFGATGKLVYAYITYSVMMMVYSLINVPYASLLGVISGDPKQRTVLSSYRMVFAFGGSILALALIEPLVGFFSSGGKDLQRGWQMGAGVIALLAVIFFFLNFFWTKERVKPIKEQANSLREDLNDLLHNRPWWILLGAGVAALIFNSIRDGAAVYYFKYYANGEGLGSLPSSLSITTLYLILGQAANIAGILLIAPLANRTGKKVAYLSSMVLATVLSIAFYYVGKENLVMVMILQVAISMCAGSIFPLLWSMYADIADYSEVKTGRRATGLIFSSSSMSQKLGWTVGGALTGWLLGYYGFQANVEQSEFAQNGIRMMLSIFPAIGAGLSILFISLYPIGEKELGKIETELNQLRNGKEHE